MMAEAGPTLQASIMEHAQLRPSDYAMNPSLPSSASDSAAYAILKQLEDMGANVFFEKPLTSSDASGSGRVVVPKAIAEQYFPKLDNQNGVPVDAVDTLGNAYHFRFRFWINNQSRMYLLEGAGELHARYHLRMGDVMIFAQKPDGTLVVAGRPCTRADQVRKPPVKRPAPSPGLPSTGSKPKDIQKRKPGDKLVDASKAKKKKPPGPIPGGQYGHGPGGLSLDLEPPVDGIFRALPLTAPSDTNHIAPTKSGRWVATINLSGEWYQALFECQEDALEAFNAAGFM